MKRTQKKAAVMAVDSSSMKRRPVLLEEAALSDTMKEAR